MVQATPSRGPWRSRELQAWLARDAATCAEASISVQPFAAVRTTCRVDKPDTDSALEYYYVLYRADSGTGGQVSFRCPYKHCNSATAFRGRSELRHAARLTIEAP